MPAIPAIKLFPIFHISASKFYITSIGNTDETVFCKRFSIHSIQIHFFFSPLRLPPFSFNLCGKSFTIFLALYFKRIKQKRKLNYEQPKKHTTDTDRNRPKKKREQKCSFLYQPSAFSFARTHAHSHTLTNQRLQHTYDRE